MGFDRIDTVQMFKSCAVPVEVVTLTWVDDGMD